MRAARAARGAPAGGSAGVAGAHKFTEGAYFLFPFRRVSRLRRPFFLRPAASPCRTGRPAAICARHIAAVKVTVAGRRHQKHAKHVEQLLMPRAQPDGWVCLALFPVCMFA